MYVVDELLMFVDLIIMIRYNFENIKIWIDLLMNLFL